MARLRTPIVATVIGEGGSGGALAIGVADSLLMLENTFYSVAAPEAAATILWRDASAPDAAAAMKMGRRICATWGSATRSSRSRLVGRTAIMRWPPPISRRR